MLRRKIETLLDEWRQTKDRKPIVIKGCRQCGKTFSVLRFARQHYRNVVYLNFMEDAHQKDKAFSYNFRIVCKNKLTIQLLYSYLILHNSCLSVLRHWRIDSTAFACTVLLVISLIIR